MRYVWIDEYLLSKAGVTKDLQKDWNWFAIKSEVRCLQQSALTRMMNLIILL